MASLKNLPPQGRTRGSFGRAAASRREPPRAAAVRVRANALQQQLALGGTHVKEAGVDTRAGRLLDIGRALVALADEIDGRGERAQVGQHVPHEDDGRVAVQHVEAAGDESRDSEQPLGAHALHVALQARRVPRVEQRLVVVRRDATARQLRVQLAVH